MDLISEVDLPVQFHEVLTKQMLKSLRCFGETGFPNAELNGMAFRAWKRWFAPERNLPQKVEQYCRDFLEKVQAAHLSVKPALELLEVCARR